MKVSSTQRMPHFKPFTLHIDVESEEEARALHNIFNHVEIRRASGLSSCDFASIRTQISQNHKEVARPSQVDHWETFRVTLKRAMDNAQSD